MAWPGSWGAARSRCGSSLREPGWSGVALMVVVLPRGPIRCGSACLGCGWPGAQPGGLVPRGGGGGVGGGGGLGGRGRGGWCVGVGGLGASLGGCPAGRGWGGELLVGGPVTG